MISTGFAGAVLIGCALLSLPVATESGERADLIDALFTSTSAVCVTGLITVDTGTYWSTFGEIVILVLIQAGGLGIMTLATLLAVLVSRRLGLRARLLAQVETKSLTLRDVRRVVRNIVLFSLGTEAVIAVILTAVLLVGHDRPWGSAAYEGVFHAISAFNNAGFSPHSDSLMSYVSDPWVCLPIACAVILGGLGFPVIFELRRSWRRPRGWSVLTRITLAMTLVLLAVGTLTLTAAEYTNPRTLGPLETSNKWLAGFFASVMARTAGFNSIDTSAQGPESLLATDILMFIGGGSAGTAGGIKITTFGLLAYVIWAEMRGEPGVRVGRRRVPSANQRQALAVALTGIAAVVVSTFILLGLSTYSLDQVMFEATSAFATVGLSTGITDDLPTGGQVVLIVLMFIGRIGPLTVASALALRDRVRRYELPEERTIVG
ncbi:TrkH family potassium uptake protein [Streptomyces sp. N2-109]|uniref:TrkH family potassium uptake protein n=1 Tax=Streptomyces gossypii TaxID=2883101 RepID=A0ABT2JR50_9ACTN|nr:TrkH family potassium uptake protein [Streptomyces gossypii]MCT2590231.1 TrkH family potassium uptake protein [Streptomyces gossypii]